MVSKVLKDKGLVLWSLLVIGFTIWLVQLVGEIFGTNNYGLLEVWQGYPTASCKME